MISPSQVHGKKLAMIVWGKKTDGSDDVAGSSNENDRHHRQNIVSRICE